MEQTLRGHLPLLVRSNFKDSVEYILQALWRTRNTGLESADRHVILNMPQLHNGSDLDPLLACLRMLMRRCVYENISKDDIPKLFPAEVLPALQRLLTLLLQKFQESGKKMCWKTRAVISSHALSTYWVWVINLTLYWNQNFIQNTVPRLKAMAWDMANPNKESTDPAAVINLKLQNDSPLHLRELDVKFLLAKDPLDMMLKSMHSIKDQYPNLDVASNGH